MGGGPRPSDIGLAGCQTPVGGPQAGFPCWSAGINAPRHEKAMALDQLRQFLARMQDEPTLQAQVLAAATADDVAQIAAGVGYSFSGDELLRFSGQKVGRVTVNKQDLPGEYN